MLSSFRYFSRVNISVSLIWNFSLILLISSVSSFLFLTSTSISKSSSESVSSIKIIFSFCLQKFSSSFSLDKLSRVKFIL